MISDQIIERHTDRHRSIQENDALFIDGNSQDARYVTFAKHEKKKYQHDKYPVSKISLPKLSPWGGRSTARRE